jgi:hypothetical protein
LFVHKERQIDFGLLSTIPKRQQMTSADGGCKSNLKNVTKLNGFNSKNDSESSENSKTFVGIRTVSDHVNRIVTQDQTQLIKKSAVRFGWDEHRKRFSPPVHTSRFRKLEAAKAKFQIEDWLFGACGSTGAARRAGHGCSTGCPPSKQPPTTNYVP